MGERARRVLSLAVVALLWAAGCSGSGGSSDAVVDPPRAGELRVGMGEDPWSLFGSGPRSRTFAGLNVYETLVALNPDYTLRPVLAERWELVEPSTWRFHLRPGVRFHDGRPLTADDVVWSWTERQLLPAPIASTLGPESIRKVDDLTVDFTPVVDNLRLPEHLNSGAGAIVPRGNYMDSTPPVGTGPFRGVGYTPKREAVVERHDGYWGEKPKVDRLKVLFLPDREARLDALRRGQVDLVMDITADDAGAVESEQDLLVLRAEGSGHHVLFLNTTNTPRAELMADKSVRQAVVLAIDRNAYVDRALGGVGRPGALIVPRAILGAAATSVAPPAHDPAEAGRLLDAAGWRPGADG